MRVAVTGVGMLTAGGDAPATRELVRTGGSMLQRVTQAGSPVPRAAFVEGPRLRGLLTRRKDAKLFSRAAQLLLPPMAAALGERGGDREQLGLFVGVRREPADGGEADAALAACARDGAFSTEALAGGGRELYPPLLPLKTLPNLNLAHVAIQLGIRGPSGTCAGGPAAGVAALIQGIEAVVEGECPAALVGASDSWVRDAFLRDWARLGLEDAPGEGGVALLLEPEGTPGTVAVLERRLGAAEPARPSHRDAVGHLGCADALLALILAGATVGDGPHVRCASAWAW